MMKKMFEFCQNIPQIRVLTEDFHVIYSLPIKFFLRFTLLGKYFRISQEWMNQVRILQLLVNTMKLAPLLLAMTPSFSEFLRSVTVFQDDIDDDPDFDLKVEQIIQLRMMFLMLLMHHDHAVQSKL